MRQVVIRIFKPTLPAAEQRSRLTAMQIPELLVAGAQHRLFEQVLHPESICV